jgi:hypothetical protein
MIVDLLHDLLFMVAWCTLMSGVILAVFGLHEWWKEQSTKARRPLGPITGARLLVNEVRSRCRSEVVTLASRRHAERLGNQLQREFDAIDRLNN